MPAFAVGREVWLSEGKALDIPFDHDPAQVLERARHHFAGQPVDVNVLPAANRRKKLLIADMDSTIINCECLDELADMAGLKPDISAITERAMRGELDFAAALARARGDAEGPGAGGAGAGLRRAHPAQSRREDAGRHHAQARRPYAAGVGRLFLFHLARREGRRLPRRSGERSARRRRGADRTWSREPILGREAKLAALEKAVAELRYQAATRSPSATAPTISP